jgi:uncharacterized protein YkwD
MMVKTLRERRTVAAAVGLAACGLLALAALEPARSDAIAGEQTCRNAHKTSAEATLRQLRKAVGCLINVERAERDRRKLRRSDALSKVAKRHTKVMLSKDCFEHVCEGERPLRKRIEASGYVKPGGEYGYGEILGCSQTPAGMVKAWMTSPNRYHRKNILDRKFRHFGIGALKGAPEPSGCKARPPVTYTVIFGWRTGG